MTTPEIPLTLEAAVADYDSVFVVVSPPRCGSTAFSRVLWRNPLIGFYAHEPFEALYFDGEDLAGVATQLRDPINLAAVTGTHPASGLLIKEMPYQVGSHFMQLASLASRPLMFLLRDPRLSIASRMRMKTAAGSDPDFPKQETGWHLLLDQVNAARQAGIEYIVIGSADFRTHPAAVFAEVSQVLGIPWDPEMLSWEPRPELPLDNLGGRHGHLYERVLASTGIEPPDELIPNRNWFPGQEWQNHVDECLDIYGQLLADPHRIHPG